MKKLVLIMSMMLFATQAWGNIEPNLPADIALKKLENGNARYAAYQMKHPNTDKKRRVALTKGQHPFAVIVTCSDSRVAPEIIFDQGLGDLFVIRNAGNVLDEHVMGSIEYAVHHLGVNLVLILGHEACGAVGAAMKDGQETPAIESIKKTIQPAICMCKEKNNYTYANVIKTHAILTVDEIMKNEELREFVYKHNVKILPAFYSIGTGEVEIIKVSE